MSAWSLLACALLAAPLALQDGEADTWEPDVAPASDEAELARAAITVADGLEHELWAAEPLVANPVAFDIDRHGNVYVAETFRLHAGVTDMREHLDWLSDELSNETVAERIEMLRKYAGDGFSERFETARERVRRLRDTDGDGRADESVVTSDRFGGAATGIGAGVLATDECVYYACIPDLWTLVDEDGDGVSDHEQRLSTGYGVHVALAGHDLHGLAIGPDRRLYFSCGDRGFDVLTQEGSRVSNPHTGAVLRCELDGSNLEVMHTGLRNPQELAFDDHGNLFTGDNNSDGGDRARIVQVLDGADSGWRFHFQYVTVPEPRGPWETEGRWKRAHEEQPAFLLPPIGHATSGPSGIAIDPGTGLSDAYRGRVLLCDFRGTPALSGVVSFALLPRGASFALGPVEPLLEGVAATDVAFGPASNVWVLDWVRGWTTTGKGRIHRIPPATAEERKRAAEVHALLAGDRTVRTPDELGALLAHRDRRVRTAAQFALTDRGAEGLRVLHDAALHGTTRLARLHGVWGLGILARHDPARLARLVPLVADADADAEVRAQAAKVLGDELRMPETETALGSGFARSVLEALASRTADEAPRVALFAALAAARVAEEIGGDSPALARAASELLARAGTHDPVLRHAGVRALAASCRSDAPSVFDDPERGRVFRRIAEADDRNVRMGALLAARRHRTHAAMARFLDDADPLVRREAARALYETDPESRVGSALLGPHQERDDRADPQFLRYALAANRRLGTDAAAQRIAEFAQDDARPLALRDEAMRFLAEWTDPDSIDPIHGGWFPLVARDGAVVRQLALDAAPALEGAPDAVLRPWLAMIAAHELRELEPRAAEIATDATREAATRVAALVALDAFFSGRYLELVAAGASDPDPQFRAACLALLPDIPRTRSLPVVERVLASGTVADRRAAYTALAASDWEEADALLASELDRLLAGELPGALALELRRAARERENPELEQRLAELDDRRRADDPELAPWLDCLEGGDPARGAELFETRADLSCVRCHAQRTPESTEDSSPVPDADETPRVGPDLDGVGARLSRRELLASIVVPNRRVAGEWATEVVRTTSGALIAGRVVAEDGGHLTLLDANGVLHEFSPAEIDERVPGVSAMPAGLAAFLTPAEMRDLIAYLANR